MPATRNRDRRDIGAHTAAVQARRRSNAAGPHRARRDRGRERRAAIEASHRGE